MRIQLVSDLHLEFAAMDISNNNADVLVLAGDIFVAEDIETYEYFFEQCNKQFPHVILIMGNHEHYHSDINETEDIIRDYLTDNSFDNFHFLNNETFELDGVNFMGTTLWTDADKMDIGAMANIQIGLNDYRVIHNGKKMLQVSTTVEMHKECLNFIHDSVTPNMKNVVVGHHAPSRQSTHERYKNPISAKINGAFVSDCDDFILDHDIPLWIHGHCHTNFDYHVGNTRVVCNPRGYVRGYSRENPEFDPNFIIEI